MCRISKRFALSRGVRGNASGGMRAAKPARVRRPSTRISSTRSRQTPAPFPVDPGIAGCAPIAIRAGVGCAPTTSRRDVGVFVAVRESPPRASRVRAAARTVPAATRRPYSPSRVPYHFHSTAAAATAPDATPYPRTSTRTAPTVQTVAARTPARPPTPDAPTHS